MISPLAFVGDVHPLFALAIGFHDRPVGVDDSLLEECVRLAGPGVAPRFVDRLLQIIQILGPEPPTEVPGRRGVGNPRGAQDVEIGFVLSS